MFISQARQFVFVHIPKTAGTALTVALEERAARDDIIIGDTPKAQRRKKRLEGLTPAGRLWKHSTLRDIDGVLSAQDLEQMFCTTLIRNPWDRAVSYYHWLQDQNFDHPAVTLAKLLEFDGFMRDPLTVTAFRDWPYGAYMTDASGAERCSSYMRIEHLEEDSAEFVAHLGFELTLPVVNESTRDADYRSYYDDALAEFVGVLCAEDVRRFGYSF